MLYSLPLMLLAGVFMPQAQALVTLSDDQMNSLLNAGGVSLAMKAQPMFFFGQAEKKPPCYPTSAVVNGQQTPSGGGCPWPNAGCNCRTPGVGIGNPGPSFPIYYTYQKCTDNEVRVAYNLFYEKDGFLQDVASGHRYDWERVLVIWNRKNGGWQPATLKMSAHSGYHVKSWGSIQNTFNDEDAGKRIGGDNGRQNLDHPKVYVGWGKHAMFDTRKTGFVDAASQGNDNEFRSQDWWYFPNAGDYVRADLSTDIGRKVDSFNYGHADSKPAVVHAKLCRE